MTLKRLKLLVLLALAIFALQSFCGGEKHTHSWEECSLPPDGENLVDPALDPDPTKDTVIFDLDDDLTSTEVSEWSERMGLKLSPVAAGSGVSSKFRLYTAEVGEGDVPKIRAHVRAHSGDIVESVDEDFLFHTTAWEPNDPLYQFQWHFEQVKAVEAWTMATGKGSVVAVIDTGVAMDESESAPVKDLIGTRQVPGYDFISKDTVARDLNGHGTHVAGTIAQATDNKYGVSGLAHGAAIMPLRVLGKNGSGTLANVAAAIYFAADNGANVINMSLGAPSTAAVMQEAIDYAHGSGVTVIAAAGNGGKRSPEYPGACENVIAVAATQFDKKTTFYSQWGPFVDIAAPGGNTKVDQNKDGRPDGVLQETIDRTNPKRSQFALFMGTSMATPHVAAGAALVNEWGVTHPDRVESILRKTSDTSMRGDDEEGAESLMTDKEFSEHYGSGIMQADSAVTSAILDPALLRLLLAMVLGLGVFVLSRKEGLLEADVRLLGSFLGTAFVFSSGLFFLPFVVPGMEIETVATVVKFLSTPMAAWDWLVLGLAQTPILASALIPGLAVLILHRHPFLKYVGGGVSVGFSGFLLAEALAPTSILLWIPGGAIVASVYLALNAVACVGLVHLSLKGDGSGNSRES